MNVINNNLFPKIIDYLKYNLSELRQRPDWFLMRKLGRFSAIRQYHQQKHACSSLNRFNQNIESNIFNQNLHPDSRTNSTLNSIIHQLEKDGIYTGLNLPPQTISQINDYAKNNRCYTCTGSFHFPQPQLGFYPHQYQKAQLKLQKSNLIAKYFNLSQCELIHQLEIDPFLKAIASTFLRTPAVHVATNMWWSFPDHPDFPVKPLRQRYHIDLDDYNFVKFFFYLTDVDNHNGPHIYIRGSHKNQPFLHQLLRGRPSDTQLLNYYGRENCLTVCGESGLGFVMNPFGFHQAAAVISAPRLMLSLIFATVDYGILHTQIDADKLKKIL